MEQQNFGNQYDIRNSVLFFKRHWKLLTLVTILALALSVVVSLLITPKYKATAILFPSNSNRQSKAILAERYSMDFLDYGSERDCEYAIQILSSQSMENAVCSHFNLAEHYGIDVDDPYLLFKTHSQYRGNISVKRTEFLGVEVSVMDHDAQWAADMANFMAAHYDSLCNQISHERAEGAYLTMQTICDNLEQDIRSLEDSLSKYKNSATYTQLIESKCNELAKLQTRKNETKVDMEQSVSHKFWLDQAQAADKKAYPKRAIVVLLGTLGTLALMILILLIVDRVIRTAPSEE